MNTMLSTRSPTKILTLVLLTTFGSRPVSTDNQPRLRDLDHSWTTDPLRVQRRAWHSSKRVILGETLYIDGGDSHTIENGNLSEYPYNSTYSLDLSTSWSPKDVRFNVIDKGDSRILNRPNLWPAPDGKSFYAINGDVSTFGSYPADLPFSPELWQFTPNSIENGTWSLTGSASSLIQSMGSKSASGNGSVYILGGTTNSRTTRRDDANTKSSADGIVSYNIKSQTWMNQSMSGFAPTGWWFDGSLYWVDNLGGTGLVIAMGGVTALPQPIETGETFVPFDHIAFFNPLTGEWRNQSTTGVIPPPRRHYCSVGVPGDNRTYEIFLHGGSIFPIEGQLFKTVQQVDIDLDQVWVLSLPSFTWYRSNYTPRDARYLHTCQVPGDPPRRQMLAVGGAAPDVDYANALNDPWPQGLGILDLTEMQWTDSYYANATAYETPKMVKDGIANQGAFPNKWDDPLVAQWLTGKSIADKSGTNSSSNIGTNKGNNKDNNVRAIAGGVAGGVVGAALLTLLLYKQRRRQQQRKAKSPKRYEKPELDAAVISNRSQFPETINHSPGEISNVVTARQSTHEILGSIPGHDRYEVE